MVKELLDADSELVAVDMLANLRTDLENLGATFVEGDATDDAVLIQAGIEKAVGICCCLPNDSDNVYVALAARGLNPNLTISARANSRGSERKLKSAGVDHVINPYVASGHRMARQMLSPNIVEFMDVVMPQDRTPSAAKSRAFSSATFSSAIDQRWAGRPWPQPKSAKQPAPASSPSAARQERSP